MKTGLTQIPNPTSSTSTRLIPAFGPSWGFFLDIDGTLVDLAERPDSVRVDAALQTILRRLLDAAAVRAWLTSFAEHCSTARVFRQT